MPDPKFTLSDAEFLGHFHVSLSDAPVQPRGNEADLEVLRLNQLLQEQKDANADLRTMVFVQWMSIVVLFFGVVYFGCKLWGK